jgi:hypothetical protein
VRRLGTYDNLLTTILFLAILLTCGLSPMQTDTWWQLRAGRDMWASGHILLTDTYSHTAAGAFWVNHEWLAEVVFYGLYRLGGLGLLTIFCAGLIAAGWMFSWSLRHGPARPAFVLFLAALVSSAGWWEPRPHAFSLLFIPLMLFLLVRRRDVWLPALFLLWAQCHGGVLLGFALLGVALGARVALRPRAWLRSAAVLLACALAMTATPLGIGFWTEIPRSLSRINQYPLDEWARPELTELVLIPFWLIAAAYVTAVVRQLRRLGDVTAEDAMLHACALTLLAGALGAVRNVGPFLMLAVPALTHLWHPTPDSKFARSTGSKERHGLNLMLMGVVAANVAMVLSVAYSEAWPRLKWTPVPAAAVRALHGCPDNLYNRYDEGGFLLWFASDRRVFLDGRQDPFPSDVVLAHIEMETGKRGYQSTFARHQIRCAFLPVESPVASLLAQDDWTTVYRDPQWVVFRK